MAGGFDGGDEFGLVTAGDGRGFGDEVNGDGLDAGNCGERFLRGARATRAGHAVDLEGDGFHGGASSVVARAAVVEGLTFSVARRRMPGADGKKYNVKVQYAAWIVTATLGAVVVLTVTHVWRDSATREAVLQQRGNTLARTLAAVVAPAVRTGNPQGVASGSPPWCKMRRSCTCASSAQKGMRCIVWCRRKR